MGVCVCVCGEILVVDSGGELSVFIEKMTTTFVLLRSLFTMALLLVSPSDPLSKNKM